jgi:hypothetical protein
MLIYNDSSLMGCFAISSGKLLTFLRIVVLFFSRSGVQKEVWIS